MKFRSVIKTLVLGFLAVIVMSPSNLLANETLSMAIGEWPPYTSEKDPKGKIAETIVTEAFKLENINVTYKYFPWKRSYKLVQAGKFIGTFPWSKTKEREGDFIFCKEPIVNSKTVLFHLKSLNFKWENYNDLKKYKIGGTLGYSSVKFLEDKGLKLDVIAKEDLNFKKLLAGRIDLFPATFVVGYNIINKLFTPDKAALFTNSPKALTEEAMCMLISKKIPNGQKIADAFDRGLKKLKESGRYEKILMGSL